MSYWLPLLANAYIHKVKMALTKKKKKLLENLSLYLWEQNDTSQCHGEAHLALFSHII